MEKKHYFKINMNMTQNYTLTYTTKSTFFWQMGPDYLSIYLLMVCQ